MSAPPAERRLGPTARRLAAAGVAGVSSAAVAPLAFVFMLGGMFVGLPGAIVAAVIGVVALAAAIGLPHVAFDEESRWVALGVGGALAVVVTIAVGFAGLVTIRGDDPWWLPLGVWACVPAGFLVTVGISLLTARGVALRVAGGILLLAVFVGVTLGFPSAPGF